MLDWLKTLVTDTPETGAAKKRDQGRNRVHIGKRVFPLATLDEHGLVVDKYDDRPLSEGQTVKLEVHINDLHGTFSFSSVVKITKTTRQMFSGVWWFLPPGCDQHLARYTRARQRAEAIAAKHAVNRR